jgi:hypothetical protein
MCFSVEADLVAGAALLPIGALSLTKVREPRELAFAALPLLFAAHQLVEALVWAGTDGTVGAGTAHMAAVAYVLFALPFLPTFVPAAVLLLEDGRRRWAVLPFLVLGLAVSAYLAWHVAANGVRVSAHPHALVYHVSLGEPVRWSGLYVVAVMGACLVSRHRAVVAFGVVNVLGLTLVAWAYRDAFASLWCVYAAVSSVLVLVHLAHRPDDRAPRRAVSDAHAG